MRADNAKSANNCWASRTDIRLTRGVVKMNKCAIGRHYDTLGAQNHAVIIAFCKQIKDFGNLLFGVLFSSFNAPAGKDLVCVMMVSARAISMFVIMMLMVVFMFMLVMMFVATTFTMLVMFVMMFMFVMMLMLMVILMLMVMLVLVLMLMLVLVFMFVASTVTMLVMIMIR